MAISFRSETTIQASPDAVRAAFVDLESWQRWMPGLVRVEKLDDGPFDIGTRWRETRRMFGREASEVFRVTEFEPALIGLLVDGREGTTGKGEYRFVYTLHPVGEDATRLTLEGEADMPGAAARVLGFLFRGMMRRGCERDMAALKAHLEGRR
jgi:carbon monoxide dehydrogenase subunit G